MNKKQIRINYKIARFLGWRTIRQREQNSERKKWMYRCARFLGGQMDGSASIQFATRARAKFCVPDYTSSLDELHEAEMELTSKQTEKYYKILCGKVLLHCHFAVVCAPLDMKIAAFLDLIKAEKGNPAYYCGRSYYTCVCSHHN